MIDFPGKTAICCLQKSVRVNQTAHRIVSMKPLPTTCTVTVKAVLPTKDTAIGWHVAGAASKTWGRALMTHIIPCKALAGRLVMLLLLLFLTIGCSHKGDTPPRTDVSREFGKIMVVPFLVPTEDSNKFACVRCPICGHIYRFGVVPTAAEEPLTTKLETWLATNGNAEIVRPENRDLPAVPSTRCHEKATDGIEPFQRLGRSYKVDAVIVGYLFRFEDRVGSNYAASEPASVAFDLHLIDVSTGKIVWTGWFDETQQALSDNLFNLDLFIKRGGTWVAADRMAEEGLEVMLETHMLP